MNKKLIDLALWIAILVFSLGGDVLALPMYLTYHDQPAYTIVLIALFIVVCILMSIQIWRKKTWYWFIFVIAVFALFLLGFINENNAFSYTYNYICNQSYYCGFYRETFIDTWQHWVVLSLSLTLPTIYVVLQLYQQDRHSQKCPACNKQVRGKEKFCTQCGAKLNATNQQQALQPPKNCPECMTKLRKQDKFCPNCGTTIKQVIPATIATNTCPSCKSPYISIDTFCGTCGSMLTSAPNETVLKETELMPNEN